MKSLLCGILSFAILINSASPALAQLVPAGRAAVRAGATASHVVVQTTHHLPALLRGAGANSKQIANIAARTHVIQAQTARQIIRLNQQLPFIQYKPWINQTALPSLAVEGNYSGIAQRILATPVLEQAPLLRNEFVLLVLIGQVTPEQLNLALDFLRSDLQKNLSAFKTIAGQTTREMLTAPEGLQAASCRKALSDAAALALTGTPEDAQALVALYRAAENGPLQEVATRLTGRGLLRLGAYDVFNEWAEPLKQEGEFWLGLTTYARQHHLPVSLHPTVEAQPAKESAGLTQWLEKESLVNGLNASGSLAATEKWMELGRVEKTAEVVPAAEDPIVQVPEASLVTPTGIKEMNFLGNPSQLEITPTALPQTAIPAQTTASAVSQPVTPTTVTPVSSGILYSGFPAFTFFKTAEKAWNWLSSFWHKEKATPTRQAVREEPGLHDNTVRPVYERSVAPRESLEAEDMQAMAAAPSHAEVAESGFKLTLEDNESVESILHNVDVTIDTGFKADGYNRVVLSKDYIFELRNLTQPAKQMAHFFFKLSSSKGALYELALATGESSLLHRELRVKIEQRPNVRYQTVSLPAADFSSGKKFNVLMEIDAKLLPGGAKDGQILLEKNGKIFYESPEGKQTLLEGYYVRLPKEDSKYWVPLMKENPATKFSLEIHSTRNKTGLLTQAVPFLQIGLGKTTAPELKARSTMGESSASLVMLSINNVLPVMMGFVNPLLKRYGEATVLRWGQGMFVAGGATALASGLYGALGDDLMTSLQLAGFISSSVMIALGTNITRFVQNNLISANRGKIVPKNSFSEPAKTAAQAGPAPTYNLQYLGRRFIEVFTKNPAAARDVVLFQTATMFKNLGTMAFLAFPWLANVAAKHAFGIDLGLDFSASYIPYSIFGLWTAMKLRRIAYKDAFPMNLTTVRNNFKEMLAATTTTLAKQPAHSLEGSETLMRVAKEIKSSIDDLTRVEIRQFKTSLAKQVATHEAESVNALREKLLATGASQDEANAGAMALQKAFDSLDHRDVSLWKVLMKPKLTPAVAAMALATMHELSVSNGFSFAMHNLLGDGAKANAFTALALYGSMSLGRILGNVISRRISGGSMYALSSLFSLGGTALMAASAGNNVTSLITGAIIASFGVGNFFSQMYEYMVGLSPKHRREIALLINYTMPIAAVMSFPMRWLVEASGFSGMDLVVAEAAAAASVMLTPGMLANSSLVKVGKNLWTQSINKIKNSWRKMPPSDTPGGTLTEAAAH